MRVTVKMFAAAREAVQSPAVTLSVSDTATVADLRLALVAEYPQLTALVERAMFAINANYAQNKDLVPTNAEIACIPPVSGG
jgi:molybdopterin synthase catalytic subunit/molybdopterin synthase sulfur carrier subunit